MSAPPLAARADIHKSCKTLEAVVNLLNDYCEAAAAIITVQKRLAKALREAAAAKVATEVPANALGASAAVFEALVEVDGKFAKLVDSECEAISADVKKWFKRLAKDEKAHDAKVAAASAKIKQAGQAYERKVKKNPEDAAEEHARYMNLLTTLGTETNQEKYTHALAVTQRHEATLYSLAGCVSRVADAEWSRSCENVRSIAPCIGRVGEWRALCEGNWTGSIPQSLPEYNNTEHEDKEEKADDTALLTPAPEYVSRVPSPGAASPPTYFSPQMNSHQVQLATAPAERADDMRDRSQSVNSIASLGSFPSPPSHFPLPPVQSNLSPISSESASSSQLQSQPASPPPRGTPTTPRADSANNSATFLDFGGTPPTSPAAPIHDSPRSMKTPFPLLHDDDDGTRSSQTHGSVEPSPSPQQPRTLPKPTENDVNNTREDRVESDEFGQRADVARAIKRSDTSRSSGSVVAAMRDKLVRSTSPSSPTPRDVPRLPMSVTSLATRYDPGSPVGGGSPTQRVSSPSADASRPYEPRTRGKETYIPGRMSFSSSQSSSHAAFPSPDEVSRRKARLDELEELEFREQEYALRMKEKEIQERARELELEQMRLANARQTRSTVQDAARLSGPMTSMADSQASPGRHPYAGSTTSTGAGNRSSQTPTPTPTRYSSYAPASSYANASPSQPSTPIAHPARASTHTPSPQPRPPSQLERAPAADHSPSCGCETCSASKYRAPRNPTPSPQSLMPPEPPLSLRPEKPKGWLRRLSMPVMNNAFGDSKKGISSSDLPSGAYYRGSGAFVEEDGRLRVDSGVGAKNRSVTNLARR